jgi:3D (Asp-Asp-Asp) domain-containing protein
LNVAVLGGVLAAGALPASGPGGIGLGAQSSAGLTAGASAAPSTGQPSGIVATAPTTTNYRLRVDAVAYHLPGRTASGLAVRKGVVAVDPKLIPLGTKLFIPGYGAGIAADVGVAIRGRVIDVWMPTDAAARKWGRKTVVITIYR